MTTLLPHLLKGGCAHFTMCILHFQLIDLDLWNVFCEVSPWGSFLFTLQKQNKVCNPGDEAMMKYIKKLFIGIPINFTFSAISPKLQGVWRRNFRFAIRKIWAFIWNKKIHYFRLSPGGWECDRHKGLFKGPYADHIKSLFTSLVRNKPLRLLYS